jgi:hypothetical protein
MENVEQGTRTLQNMIEDIFDTTGTFRNSNFQFRFDASTDKIQFRIGNFANPSSGWQDLTTFFNITGAFSNSTTYNNFDIVTVANNDVYIVHGLTSGTTFASESNFTSSSNTEKIVDVSGAQDWAVKTNGIVDSTDYSSKAYAIGGTGVDTGSGSAKDWATKTSGTVGNTSENSAKYHATAAASSASTATTQANLATTNGAAQVALATAQVALATTIANNSASSASASSTSATNSANSASAASTSETNAAASAATATTQASLATSNGAAQVALATTQANNAATSATSAAASQVAAASSAAAAATALDSFDDRYLGVKFSNPTQDNDGNALVSGALYFNDSANEMRVYDGANWIAAVTAGSASLILYEYTATSGQTTFSGSDDNALTLSYIVNNIQVVMNGVILDPSDYTASNGTSVVLAAGAATGDLINIYAFKSFTVADTVSASAGGTFASNVNFNANANFGNNNRAIFGNAFEIFHDGFNTYLAESGGTGNVYLRANNLVLLNNSNETYVNCISDGAVTLYHNNAVKLATTSTGVDVTGTVTADGLTVGTASPAANRALHVSSTAQKHAKFERTGSATSHIEFQDSTTTNQPSLGSVGDNLTFETAFTERMRLDASGNLGLGSSSPRNASGFVGITLDDTSGSFVDFNDSGTRVMTISGNATGNDINTVTAIPLRFKTNNTERMRLTSAGLLGLGTTLPSSKLHVNGSFRQTGATAPFEWTVNAGALDYYKLNAVGYADNLIVANSGGNVGIGTNTPAGPLEVHKSGSDTNVFITTGATTLSTTILFGDSASNDRGRVMYDHNNDSMRLHTAGSERLRITSAGSVGIGTASPAYNLDVFNSASSGAPLLAQFKSAGGDTQLYVDNSTITTQLTADASNTAGIVGTKTNHPFVFRTNNAERVRIDTSGNLLVGKTASGVANTGAELQSSGFTSITRDGGPPLQLNRKTSNGDIAVFKKDGSTVGLIGTLGGRMYAGSGDVGVFFDSTNNAITPYSTDADDTVDNAIDLGLSNRRYKDLRLSGRVYATHVELGASGSFINFENANTSIRGSATNGYLRFLTSGSERMRLNASGNMLLGTSSPYSQGERLAVSYPYLSGTGIVIDSGAGGGAAMRFRTNSTLVGSIVTTTSSTAFNTSSDYRLKKNVTADWDATTRLKQLNPVRFNFIADEDTTVDGFLAHEVQDVVPEAISGTKDGMRDEEYEVTPAVLDDDGNEVTPAVMGTRSVPDYQGIDQSKLVPLLVKTIQELEARIAALENA